MLDRSARRVSLQVLSLLTTIGLAGCGGDEKAPAKPLTTSKPDTKADANAETKADAKADPAPDAKADPTPDAKAEGGEPPKPDPSAEAEGAAGEEGAAEGGEDAGAADSGMPTAETADAAEGGAAEGGEADGAEAGGGSDAAPAGKDSASLIKEARTTKTTDERALEALAEAEAAGAKVKELARAAKARGDYLYKSPDRAKVFYEWSAAKDEEYADPVFALAKQKAVTGDLEDVVKLLKQVSERKGGKKLLEQIDFDPTWDIVKDDPEVRALL
ncbi:MAG: hypothetical protein AAGA54_36285 [Myxococcota bacterium]